MAKVFSIIDFIQLSFEQADEEEKITTSRIEKDFLKLWVLFEANWSSIFFAILMVAKFKKVLLIIVDVY